MRKQFIAIASVAALAIAGVAGAVMSTSAEAQQGQKAPVILIVDQGQVLAQSKVGLSMGPQLQKLQDAANTELNAEAEKIVKEGEDLKKQRDLMAEDVWLEKAKQLAVKQNNLPVLREVRIRELDLSRQQALSKVMEELRPILKDIVESRGATLLIDRSAVMYASVDTDITQQVISELDKKMKSVKVEKIDLAELQKQAQKAQKKK